MPYVYVLVTFHSIPVSFICSLRMLRLLLFLTYSFSHFDMCAAAAAAAVAVYYAMYARIYILPAQSHTLVLFCLSVFGWIVIGLDWIGLARLARTYLLYIHFRMPPLRTLYMRSNVDIIQKSFQYIHTITHTRTFCFSAIEGGLRKRLVNGVCIANNVVACFTGLWPFFRCCCCFVVIQFIFAGCCFFLIWNAYCGCNYCYCCCDLIYYRAFACVCVK